MSTKESKATTYQLIMSFTAAFLFASGLLASLLLLKENQDIRQQAAVTDVIYCQGENRTCPPGYICVPPQVHGGQPHCEIKTGCLDSCPIENLPDDFCINGTITTYTDECGCTRSSCDTNLTADLNHDGAVNIDDYTILSNEFFKNLDAYQADITGDGKVDIDDYTILSDQFSLL